MRTAALNGAALILFPEVFLSGGPIWLRALDVAHHDELLKIGPVARFKLAIAIDGPVTGEEVMLHTSISIDTGTGSRLKLDLVGHSSRPKLPRLEHTMFRRHEL